MEDLLVGPDLHVRFCEWTPGEIVAKYSLPLDIVCNERVIESEPLIL